MKSPSIAGAGLASTWACAVIVAALAFSAVPVHSQTVSAPVVVRPANPVKSNPDSKNQWLKAEVIHADASLIIVRERDDIRRIHTFTFAPGLKEKMVAILDAGGYHYGDKVKILHQPGQTVALKIHGKPSRPI